MVSTMASSTKPPLHRQVILLGLAALLNDTSSDMIYPLLPIFLSAQLGATPWVIGMIEGSAEALAAFLKLAAGSWSDRVRSRKPFVVGGYLLAALSRLLIASAVRWPMVFSARLLDRSGKGIRSAPRDALICDVTPVENRGRAFGLHRAMDHTGAIAGPLLAALCLSVLMLPMRTVFYLAAIPAAAGVILLLFALRETKAVDAPEAAPQNVPKAPLGAPFRTSLFSIGLFYLANSSDAFLILQAYRAGVSAAVIPLIWAAHHGVKALFSTWAGAMSDRTDRRNLLITGWFVYAVIYLIFPFVHSTSGFLLMFVLYSIPFTLTEGTEKAWISDSIPSGMRGRAFGFYYLVVGLCTLGGTALFGWLYQVVSPIAAFHTGAGLAAAAAVTVWIQRETDRKAA